jgi:hypothetical protein
MRREGCFRFVCGSVYVVVCVCVCFACVCFLRGGTEYVRKFACVVVGSGGRQGGGHPGGRWRVESGGACSAPVAADCWLPAGWTLTQGHEVGEGHEVLGQVGAVGAAVGGDDGGAGAGAGGAARRAQAGGVGKSAAARRTILLPLLAGRLREGRAERAAGSRAMRSASACSFRSAPSPARGRALPTQGPHLCSTTASKPTSSGGSGGATCSTLAVSPPSASRTAAGYPWRSAGGSGSALQPQAWAAGESASAGGRCAA